MPTRMLKVFFGRLNQCGKDYDTVPLVSRSQTLYLTAMLGKSQGTCPYLIGSSADIAQRSAKSTFFPLTHHKPTAEAMAVSFSRNQALESSLTVLLERSQIFSTHYTKNRHWVILHSCRTGSIWASPQTLSQHSG